MLQQTRVNAVIDHFQRFMKRFPDVVSLSNAKLDDVFIQWKGLGYYRRARNLHECSMQIVNDHNGVFPNERDKALKLKGIGDYSAASILSICYGAPHAAVDGNAVRVISRLKGLEGDKSDNISEAKNIANYLMENWGYVDPGLHNQSIMELGAMVCVPGTPRCEICPVCADCVSFQKGGKIFASEIPMRIKKSKIELKLTCYIIKDHSEKYLWVVKDKNSLLLKDSWFLPSRQILFAQSNKNCQSRKTNGLQSLSFRNIDKYGFVTDKIKHTITNYRIEAKVMEIRLKKNVTDDAFAFDESYDVLWKKISVDDYENKILSSLGTKILHALHS